MDRFEMPIWESLSRLSKLLYTIFWNTIVHDVSQFSNALNIFKYRRLSSLEWKLEFPTSPFVCL